MHTPDENIGYLLNKATLKLRRELQAELAFHDVTPQQWAVLRDVHEQERLPEGARRVAPSDVASRLFADRPTISGVVDRLVQRGYLYTMPNPSDRRSMLLALTPTARELIPVLDDVSHDLLHHALGGLSREQLTGLAASLHHMIRNLESRRGE